MTDWLPQQWLKRGPVALLLWPLSLVHQALSGLRLWLYQRGWLRIESLSVPVIVVGNVVAGGAGKTPLVLALIDHLRQRGWHPGVISRGHGRRSQQCSEVQADSSAEHCGDEPLLIKQRTSVPVFVAPSRVEAGRALLQAHPQVNVIIADDGLQHHRLARDLNIAVFDERGLGNGYLLPAGPLRETWPRRSAGGAHRLRGIDLILRSGAPASLGGFSCQRRLAAYGRTAEGTAVPLSSLQGQRLQALAGIAKPAQFFDMLGRSGLTLEATQALPDHHEFSQAELPADPDLTLLITEKDAVKLMPLARPQGPRLLAVPLEIEPEAAFFEALASKMQAWPQPAHPIPSHHGHPTS
ncbi:MAG: tetraacyldisaccharide 4'-kinase [Betaproteobacteria bacterium]